MGKIGNEATLIIKLANERTDNKIATRDRELTGEQNIKTKRDWKNGAEWVLREINSIVKELETKR